MLALGPQKKRNGHELSRVKSKENYNLNRGIVPDKGAQGQIDAGSQIKPLSPDFGEFP